MATFYIDADNGTNTYTGLKITGTIDSTADSTHFVDSALTGSDDYINGSFFYNETTGKGTLISDFVSAGDTVTLTDADASMAAGDTYYILHAYKTLHKFGESSRSVGDRAILRRGMTGRYDDGGDLFFLSNGTIDDPIIMEADYANNWKDDVDLSATATATLTFGSKTITFASDISGVLAAGDWIYVAAEDAKEFAYEVATVVTTDVTLFLPYKGDQAGSGKTMTNMQSTPIWNIAAGNFQWNFSADSFWKTQGIHIKGTDLNGNVEVDSSAGQVFKDCIFEGDGVSAYGIHCPDDKSVVMGLKCRFDNHTNNLGSSTVNGALTGLFKDCLFDNAESAINASVWDDIIFEECESKNQTIGDLRTGATGATGAHQSFRFKGRNLILSSATKVDRHEFSPFGEFLIEDFDGTIGDTRQLTGFSTAEGTPILQSETSTVRSGGSNISIKFTPSTKLSTIWEFSRIKIFELPIYATTASKKYEIFFRPTATADWTDDPTNIELWIEIEYWGHASNNFRKILKSIETIDMNGSTNFTALSVTVAPAQAGVAYLKAYYAKTKESSKANTFFCDPIPVIT